VNDGKLGFDSTNFTITVQNTPAAILVNDVPWAEEDTLYTINYASSDDGQGKILWNLDTDATWLSINSTTGVLSGIPQNENVGIFFVNVTVHDGNDETYHNFSLTVNNTNDAPSITTFDVVNAVEDQFYSVDYDADDVDGDTLTWSISTSATWLSIDPQTGELSGTPTNLDVGFWGVTISCVDNNNGTDSQTFTIDVANVNDAPQITYFLPNAIFPSVEEGMSLDFNITYSDEDSSVFTILWILDDVIVRQNVPFWSYQPEYGTGGDHDVLVNITDAEGASVQKSWIVIVTQANRAPQIDGFEPMNLLPILESNKKELVFSVSASDPDLDTLTYEWYIDGNDTGERSSTFTLDRSLYDEGTYELEIWITDENGSTTSQIWEITVQPKEKEEKEEFILMFLILVTIIAAIIGLIMFFVLKKGKNEIEDIFIITNNGILLAHKSKEFHPDMDDDIMGSMLTAVQDFVKDSFKEKSKFGLKRLDFGDSVIHIQPGKEIYAAVILSGDETDDFEESLEKLVNDIETKYADVLEDWDGDLDTVRGLKDMLDDLIK
jgi:VCBS repeat-containing protein